MKMRVKSIPTECWLLLVFYLGSRLVNLTLLPVFCDEAIHIDNAQRVTLDPFASLHQGSGKLAHDWLTAAFVWLHSDPLLSARLSSVFAGAFSMVGLYVVGTTLYSRRIGAIAATLYIISPLMLFHDRMLLADVLLNSCAIWALGLSLLSLTRGGLKYLAGLGVAMGLGMLSKLTGIFLLFTPLAVWAFVCRTDTRRPPKRLAVAYLTAGLVVSPALVHPLRARLLTEIERKSIAASAGLTFPGWIRLVVSNTKVVLNQLGAYLTVPALLLLGLSLLLALVLRNREGGLLWVLGVLPVLALVVSSAGFLPPRFFLFTTSPMLASAAWCIDQVSEGLTRVTSKMPVRCHRGLSLSRGSWVLPILLLLLVSLPQMRFDYRILTDPSQAALPPVDRFQYVAGWPSGYGVLEAVGWLKREAKHSELQIVTYHRGFGVPHEALLMYLRGNLRVTVVGQDPTEPVSPKDASAEILFVLNPPLEEERDIDFATLNPRSELLTRFIKPGAASAIEIYAIP